MERGWMNERKKWSQQHGAIPKATTVNKHGGCYFHSNRDISAAILLKFQYEAYSIDANTRFHGNSMRKCHRCLSNSKFIVSKWKYYLSKLTKKRDKIQNSFFSLFVGNNSKERHLRRESNIHFLVKSLNYLLITKNYRIQRTFAMQRGEKNEKEIHWIGIGRSAPLLRCT